MDPINYSVKDFMLNESFQTWIFESDEEVKAYWEQWLNAHPNKKDLIRESGLTILSMKEANEKNLTRECDQVWNMISASIRDLERASAVKIREIESE